MDADRLAGLIDRELTRDKRYVLKSVFEAAQLSQTGANSYTLRLPADMASLLGAADKAHFEKLVARFAGQGAALAIVTGEKPFEQMSFAEKTRAIVGNTPVKIVSKNTKNTD